MSKHKIDRPTLPCPFCGGVAEVTQDRGSKPPEYIDSATAQRNGLGVSGGWLGVWVDEASCRSCGVMWVPLVIWEKRVGVDRGEVMIPR